MCYMLKAYYNLVGTFASKFVCTRLKIHKSNFNQSCVLPHGKTRGIVISKTLPRGCVAPCGFWFKINSSSYGEFNLNCFSPP